MAVADINTAAVVLPAVVTGSAAISAIWIANRTNAKADDRRWRREHRKETYVTLIGCVSGMFTEHRKVIEARREGVERDMAALNQHVERYNEVIPAVVLFGSSSIIHSTNAVLAHLNRLRPIVVDGELPSESTWSELDAAGGEIRDELINACRQDLQLGEVKFP